MGIKRFIVRELIRLKPFGTIHRWEKIHSIKNMTMLMVFVLQARLEYKKQSTPSFGHNSFFISIITGGAIEMILTDLIVTRGNLFEQVEMVFDDLVSIILRIYKGKFLVDCKNIYNMNES